jgi:hypothetical protein
MCCAKNCIFELLMYTMMFSFLMVSLTFGGELLRYSQNDPKIMGLIEGVKGKQGHSGISIAKNIVGIWTIMCANGGRRQRRSAL